MLAALVLVHASCSSRVDTLASTSSESTSGSSSTSTTSDTSTSTTGPITGADDATSYNIIDEPDLGADSECDPWLQDCPLGEKCTPYGDDGEDFWTTTRCRPIVGDPRSPGESCSAEGWRLSGIDECAVGSMCWNFGTGGSSGECASLCQGSYANPFCPDACTFCNQLGDAGLSVCLPMCDPLMQDCHEGEACYPIVETFACVPDASGRDGSAGQTCSFINECDQGLLCVDAELLPACGGANCCTPFCDVAASDDCDPQLPGSVCTPLSGPGQVADTCLSTGTVGACMLPP